MARLPDIEDYGGRENLRTGRLDVPGTGSQEFAAAATAAAENFATALEAQKAKDDDLNYSLARNEMIAADLDARGKLEGDQDYKTHNDRYTEDFRLSREEIGSRYDLSPRDRALLGSEGDLIGARGNVVVSAAARGIEVDQGFAALTKGVETAKENMLRATDYESRNKVIEGQIEAIDAAEKAGYFGDNGATKAELMRQELTQTLATSSVAAMSDEDQIRVLSESLARRKGWGASKRGELSAGDAAAPSIAESDQRVRDKRKAAGLPEYPEGVEPGDTGSPYQGDFVGQVSDWGKTILGAQKGASGVGPVSQEELLAGGGSESVGDFIHADTAAAMLKSALSRDKENRERTEAFTASDRAAQIYPEDIGAQLEHIAATTKGEVRRKAQQEARQANLDKETAKVKVSTDHYNEYSGLMMGSTPEEPFRFSDIPVESLDEMLPAHEKALRDYSLKLSQGEQWAEFTQFRWTDDGSMSMDEWNDFDNFGRGGKTGQNLDTPIYHNAFAQKEWDMLKAEQDALKILEAAQVNTPNMKPYVDDVLVATEFMPQTGRTDAQSAVAARVEIMLAEAVARKSAEMKPPRQLSTTEIKEELNHLMKEKAYVEEWGRDPEVRVPLMTGAQLEKAYMPIDDTKIEMTSIDGKPVSYYKFLLQRARQLDRRWVPDDDKIARAAFAMQALMSDEEIDRRLLGK